MEQTKLKALRYELGVLMFHSALNEEHSGIISVSFDSLGNFVSILRSLNEEDLSLLKEGFLAECENQMLSPEKAEELFAEAVKTVSEEE